MFLSFHALMHLCAVLPLLRMLFQNGLFRDFLRSYVTLCSLACGCSCALWDYSNRAFVPFHFSCLCTFLSSGFSNTLDLCSPPTSIPLFLIPGCMLNKSLQHYWRYHDQLALGYLTGVGREEPWAGWQRSRFQLCFRESPQNQSWSARTWIPRVYLGTCVLFTAGNTCLGEPYPIPVAAQFLCSCRA